MIISRRISLTRIALGLASIPILRSGSALAGNDVYHYDPLGRLISVSYADGSSIAYSYDAAGNRQSVVQTAPSSGFTATISIPGPNPVNLRSLANSYGYSGVQDATVTFLVGNGVTIIGPGGVANYSGQDGGPGGLALDSGAWPTSSYSIALTLTVQSGGAIYGGGGGGGQGGYYYSSPPPGNGGSGGDAVNCQVPMTINVNSGGAIRSGGDGGEGGSGNYDNTNDVTLGGGGGGGGAPNGAAGPGGGYYGVPGAGYAGGPGTISGGGLGGTGGSSGFYQGYPGETGVTYGSGYAVRKNGNSVTVNNNGTISGSVG